MPKKITVGVVGCGNIFKKHYAALIKNKNLFDIIEICEIDLKKIERYKFNKNIIKFDNYSKFISTSRADIIILCTPNHLHYQQSLLAAEYNKNILTEKPMSLNFKDSKRMVNLFKKKNLHLFVLMQIRFNPIINKLKKMISNKNFGEIRLINFNVIWNRSQEYYDSAIWRGTKSMDGGIFLNQTSHHLDLITFLFGLPKKINTLITKTRRNIQVEDTGTINMMFDNFAIGSFNVTMLNNFGNLETSMTIIGTKGSIIVGGLSLDKIKYYRSSANNQKILNLNKKDRLFFTEPSKGHEIYYKNMYNYLMVEKNNTPTGADCLNTMKLIDTIYKSSKIIDTKNKKSDS